MFTNYTELLERLRGQVPDALISTLTQIFGNCMADLSTFGQVVINADGSNSTVPGRAPVPVSDIANTTDRPYGALLAYNPESSFDPTTGAVSYGYGLDVKGVARMDPAVIGSLYVTNIYNTGGTPFGTDVEVVTDVQITGTTLQKKTRTVKVLSTTAESAWTTVFTFATVAQTITDVDFTSPNFRKATLADVVVISKGAAVPLATYHACVTQAGVIDVDYNSPNLQQNKVDLIVPAIGTPTGMTTWQACVNDDFVKDVDFVSPNFVQNKRNAMVLELGTATGNTTWEAATKLDFLVTDVDYSSPNLRKARTADVWVIDAGSAGGLTTYTTALTCP